MKENMRWANADKDRLNEAAFPPMWNGRHATTSRPFAVHRPDQLSSMWKPRPFDEPVTRPKMARKIPSFGASNVKDAALIPKLARRVSFKLASNKKAMHSDNFGQFAGCRRGQVDDRCPNEKAQRPRYRGRANPSRPSPWPTRLRRVTRRIDRRRIAIHSCRSAKPTRGECNISKAPPDRPTRTSRPKMPTPARASRPP